MLVWLGVGLLLVLLGVVCFGAADRLGDLGLSLTDRPDSADVDRAVMSVVGMRIVAGLVIVAGAAVVLGAVLLV